MFLFRSGHVNVSIIIVVCLISGLLVYPWITRSLNRARHASRTRPPGYGGSASGHFGGMNSGSVHGKADNGASGGGDQP